MMMWGKLVVPSPLGGSPMPFRPFSREQDWLFPPSLGELIPQNHPARFVAAFTQSVDRSGWRELEIDVDGEVAGAAAYHPIALICVWLYGFMIGLRSSRKLEAACWDQLPFLWLTGWQRPDHNTLWRFYKSNREGMARLFKRTVKTAVTMGLVEMAVQAIDGTRVAGNAARGRTLGSKELERLLERTDRRIAELEEQGEQEEAVGEAQLARLPEELAKEEALRERVRSALEVVKGEEGPKEINLTDPEAVLVKGQQGVMAGYNAQAAVVALDAEVAGGTGRLITATEVVAEAHDYGQAVPMLEAAEANTGEKAGVSLFDAGYHSGENLQGCWEKGYQVLMAESQEKALENPYHKDRFEYDAESDSYLCPEGERLLFKTIARRKGRPPGRIYRASGPVCRGCEAFGKCTKDKDLGRSLEIGPHEEELRRNRASMATEEGKAVYARRKELPEPVFGVLKESQGARRFLLRGLANVRAEWALLAAAFNLRTLYRVWRRYQPNERLAFFQMAST